MRKITVKYFLVVFDSLFDFLEIILGFSEIFYYNKSVGEYAYVYFFAGATSMGFDSVVSLYGCKDSKTSFYVTSGFYNSDMSCMD